MELQKYDNSSYLFATKTITQESPKCWTQHHTQKYNLNEKIYSTSFYNESQIYEIEEKFTVVANACWYLDMCQSQCNAKDKILKIVISILSAIQHNPVNKESLAWNFPNPNAFTACDTVKVSIQFNWHTRSIFYMK